MQSPDATIRYALELSGGGQWAGKSTVSGILAERHDTTRHDTTRRRGIPVIEVDGTRDAEAIADDVAGHFEPFLL